MRADTVIGPFWYPEYLFLEPITPKFMRLIVQEAAEFPRAAGVFQLA